jgi:hypothetical protein
LRACPARSSSASRDAITLAPDRLQLYARAVDGDLELMRFARDGGKLHFDDVGAIDRNVTCDGNSAARAARQLGNTLVRARHLFVDITSTGRVAHGESADLPCGIEARSMLLGDTNSRSACETAADVVRRKQVVNAHFSKRTERSRSRTAFRSGG